MQRVSIRPTVKLIFHIFKGFELYLVGGYVRDMLLKTETHDIDFAINAPLKKWTHCLKSFEKLTIYEEYQSCTFKYDNDHITISRMRKDTACDGRHAHIIPTHTLEEDAIRRDFTVNAIYADQDGYIIDPVKGMRDLRKKKVRFIGDPAKRVEEDVLRVLRYFRFCALLEDQLDDTLLSIMENVNFDRISKQRFVTEYMKIFEYDLPTEFIQKMHKTIFKEEANVPYLFNLRDYVLSNKLNEKLPFPKSVLA